jgi:hypothetical protein
MTLIAWGPPKLNTYLATPSEAAAGYASVVMGGGVAG